MRMDALGRERGIGGAGAAHRGGISYRAIDMPWRAAEALGLQELCCMYMYIHTYAGSLPNRLLSIFEAALRRRVDPTRAMIYIRTASPS